MLKIKYTYLFCTVFLLFLPFVVNKDYHQKVNFKHTYIPKKCYTQIN